MDRTFEWDGQGNEIIENDYLPEWVFYMCCLGFVFMIFHAAFDPSFWAPEIEKTFVPMVIQMDETNATQKYIERFHKVARMEMKKYGIPASIKLAQGIVESDRGRSLLCRKGNAHFAIKCSSGYRCGSHKEGKFRYYSTAWDSWRDHSIFLQKQRYIHLKKYGMDYKKWAYGLRQAGYAQDKKYPQKLINIIEKYKLYKYDE